MINAGTQTDVALDQMAQDAHDAAGSDVNVTQDPEAPQTAFPTAMELTRDQEEKMVKFALDYVDRLETQMGRRIFPEGMVFVPDETTHFGRRDKFTLRYYNHVEDRKAGSKFDSIWQHSNITASLSQRTTLQMVARANNFFYGTDPWFSVTNIGTEDKPLAERIDRHSKWKFEQTGLKDELMLATEFAFVRGESVLKTTHKTQDRYYKKRGAIICDENGERLVDSDGNFVFQGAAFVPEMEAAPPDPAIQQQAMAAGQPIPPALVPTGKQVLKSDPKVYLPVTPIYKQGVYPVKKRLFHGPECKLVYYKDFLCSLDAPNIHDAELIAHVYDMPLMTLIQMCRREDLTALGAGDSLEKMQQAVEAIRNLQGAGSEPKSAANQPRPDFGGKSNQGSPENPKAEVAEVYMTYDADEDGIAEEIMLVLDRQNRFPVFYDYLDNVTPRGRRPFEVVRAKPIDGVWWGMGSMEYFEPEQEFIDLMVNRKNFKMSQAGRITFWNPYATVEGSANPSLKLNNGKTYRLREGMKAEDALVYVTLPDDGADLMEFIQFFMQLMQLKSGIINAGDQEASGMPTSDTATGIRNVEKSGQEMFAQWLNSLEPGHRDALKANITTLYANLDTAETYRFFDGEQSLQDTITPEEVADLEFDVDILLTRVHTEQVLQMSAECRALITEFYFGNGTVELSYWVSVQPLIAPFYRDSLKALRVTNADDLIKPQQPPPMMQPGQAAPSPGQPQIAGPGQPAMPALPEQAAGPMQPAQTPGPVDPAKNLVTPTPPTPRPEQSAAMI